MIEELIDGLIDGLDRRCHVLNRCSVVCWHCFVSCRHTD